MNFANIHMASVKMGTARGPDFEATLVCIPLCASIFAKTTADFLDFIVWIHQLDPKPTRKQSNPFRQPKIWPISGYVCYRTFARQKSTNF